VLDTEKICACVVLVCAKCQDGCLQDAEITENTEKMFIRECNNGL
jgi:hypothetical protein